MIRKCISIGASLFKCVVSQLHTRKQYTFYKSKAFKFSHFPKNNKQRFRQSLMEKTKTLNNRTDVEQKLKELGITHKVHSHKACLNMKDMAENVKLDQAPFIKNMVYSDKKDNIYYIIAHVDTQVNKGFWKKVGTSSGNVRMVKEDVLKDVLGITIQGSVNPFGLLNDKEKKIKKFIIDKTLMA